MALAMDSICTDVSSNYTIAAAFTCINETSYSYNLYECINGKQLGPETSYFMCDVETPYCIDCGDGPRCFEQPDSSYCNETVDDPTLAPIEDNSNPDCYDWEHPFYYCFNESSYSREIFKCINGTMVTSNVTFTCEGNQPYCVDCPFFGFASCLETPVEPERCDIRWYDPIPCNFTEEGCQDQQPSFDNGTMLYDPTLAPIGDASNSDCHSDWEHPFYYCFNESSYSREIFKCINGTIVASNITFTCEGNQPYCVNCPFHGFALCRETPVEPEWCDIRWYDTSSCRYTVEGCQDQQPSFDNVTILGDPTLAPIEDTSNSGCYDWEYPFYYCFNESSYSREIFECINGTMVTSNVTFTCEGTLPYCVDCPYQGFAMCLETSVEPEECDARLSDPTSCCYTVEGCQDLQPSFDNNEKSILVTTNKDGMATMPIGRGGQGNMSQGGKMGKGDKMVIGRMQQELGKPEAVWVKPMVRGGSM